MEKTRGERRKDKKEEARRNVNGQGHEIRNLTLKLLETISWEMVGGDVKRAIIALFELVRPPLITGVALNEIRPVPIAPLNSTPKPNRSRLPSRSTTHSVSGYWKW